MLNKIFGSKEKEGFFLEFDDASGTPSAQTEPPKAPEVAAAPVEQKKAPAPEPVKEETPVATEMAAPTEAPEKPAAKKKTTKKTTAKKAPAKKAEQPTPAPAPAVPAKPVAKKEPEPVVLFAPNYLMPTPTSSRRRPSANMGGFLDMARQMKRR